MQMEQERKVKNEIIICDHVKKTFFTKSSKTEVIDDLDIRVKENEFLVLFGPGQCGKTTVLNVMAGLEPTTKGKVIVNGKEVTKPGPERGFIYQTLALFPWFTVLENVTFGPVMQGVMPRNEAKDKALHMMGQMGLRNIAHNYPSEISSGMRRRVEIARAMMNNPRVLLLDEPFRAMDALTKTVVHQFLLDVYDKNKTTVFFITHDLDEAIFLGSKVYIMTTRPATIKKILTVDIPRPRDFRILASPEYQRLRDDCIAAVHEEAVKAFKAGEREM